MAERIISFFIRSSLSRIAADARCDPLHVYGAGLRLDCPRPAARLDQELGDDVAMASPAEARTERILDRVREIPEGYVRTYGDIDPAAPRLVGLVLSAAHDVPWHRVVRADGTVPKGARQRELLAREGVPMRGDRVDLREARMPPL
jgi:methylated-DNA-protein-cysteine methyltransferase-like protein